MAEQDSVGISTVRFVCVDMPTEPLASPLDFTPQKPRRFEDQVRDACRVRHYSIRTEEAYWGWARRFILFHGKRHPKEMGALKITEFLTDLAVRREVAASTHLARNAPAATCPVRRRLGKR